MGKLRDDNVTSLDFAEFAAAIMASVVQQDWQVATAGVSRDEPAITGTQVYPATDIRPSMFIAHGPTFAATFIGGVTNPTLALKYWQGFFLFNPLPFSTAPRNTFTEALSDFVMSELTALSVGVGALKVFVGHSFGGTVAQLCAARAQAMGGTSRGYWCTFGQPKWAKGQDAQIAGNVPGARWFNQGDPVPAFPFTVRDSLATLLLLSPLMQRQLGEFVQSRGGMQVNDDGTVDPEVLPTAATIGQVLSFITWIAGQDASADSPHSIRTYATRLQTAAAAVRQPMAALRLSTVQEQPSTVSNRLYTQAEQRIATTVSTLQAQQNVPLLNVPRPRLFTATRQGRVYPINFGDVVVGLTSDKRTARSVCRQFNVALRHLQAIGFVDTENLISQFQAYLAAAADPGSGFSPVMNTNLPV